MKTNPGVATHFSLQLLMALVRPFPIGIDYRSPFFGTQEAFTGDQSKYMLIKVLVDELVVISKALK